MLERMRGWEIAWTPLPCLWSFGDCRKIASPAFRAAGGVRSMPSAKGTFDVTISPEHQSAAPPGGAPTARMKISKTFAGDLVGTAEGTMLSGGVPAPGNAAAYVAIDQVTGILAGKAGGFMLVHRGIVDKSGGSDISVLIALDSGTGALEGISGSLTIEQRDGRHFYELAYELPDNLIPGL